MSDTPTPPESGTASERVYRTLRRQIMHGLRAPGVALTLRGVAAEFNVSMTPVREAIRRLVAEGALTLSSSGRVATPSLSNERIEELAAIRALLEPELAARALPRAYPALIDRLRTLNSVVDQMAVKHDESGYIRSNQEFHRTLYLRAQAPAMLAMVETVWLQLGPTMHQLYSRLQQTERLGSHREIIAALQGGDEHILQTAVRRDVTQGLRMLGS